MYFVLYIYYVCGQEVNVYKEDLPSMLRLMLLSIKKKHCGVVTSAEQMQHRIVIVDAHISLKRLYDNVYTETSATTLNHFLFDTLRMRLFFTRDPVFYV